MLTQTCRYGNVRLKALESTCVLCLCRVCSSGIENIHFPFDFWPHLSCLLLSPSVVPPCSWAAVEAEENSIHGGYRRIISWSMAVLLLLGLQGFLHASSGEGLESSLQSGSSSQTYRCSCICLCQHSPSAWWLRCQRVIWLFAVGPCSLLSVWYFVFTIKRNNGITVIYSFFSLLNTKRESGNRALFFCFLVLWLRTKKTNPKNCHWPEAKVKSNTFKIKV